MLPIINITPLVKPVSGLAKLDSNGRQALVSTLSPVWIIYKSGVAFTIVADDGQDSWSADVHSSGTIAAVADGTANRTWHTLFAVPLQRQEVCVTLTLGDEGVNLKLCPTPETMTVGQILRVGNTTARQLTSALSYRQRKLTSAAAAEEAANAAADGADELSAAELQTKAQA